MLASPSPGPAVYGIVLQSASETDNCDSLQSPSSESSTNWWCSLWRGDLRQHFASFLARNFGKHRNLPELTIAPCKTIYTQKTKIAQFQRSRSIGGIYQPNNQEYWTRRWLAGKLDADPNLQWNYQDGEKEIEMIFTHSTWSIISVDYLQKELRLDQRRRSWPNWRENAKNCFSEKLSSEELQNRTGVKSNNIETERLHRNCYEIPNQLQIKSNSLTLAYANKKNAQRDGLATILIKNWDK